MVQYFIQIGMQTVHRILEIRVLATLPVTITTILIIMIKHFLDMPSLLLLPHVGTLNRLEYLLWYVRILFLLLLKLKPRTLILLLLKF